MMGKRNPRTAQTAGGTTAKEGDMTSLQNTLDEKTIVLEEEFTPPACEAAAHDLSNAHAGPGRYWIIGKHECLIAPELTLYCATFVDYCRHLDTARCEVCKEIIHWSDLFAIVGEV